MQIQQIEKLDKKRVMVILADGRRFSLYQGENRRYGLQEGAEMSEEVYQEIHDDILIKRARKRTLHLLEQMDRTEAQVRDKLRQGYYQEDVIEDAIAYVKQYHYLDDLQYARNYVRNQGAKKSWRKIQMELMGKGIARALAEQALEEEYQQEREQELILKWIEKKQYSSETADFKDKRRMYQFLLRKGFQSDDILHILDQV